MPHVIVKMHPGRSEEKKRQLADAIVKDVASIAGCSEDAVSLAIEEIPPGRWDEEVHKPDILGREESLYKRPRRPSPGGMSTHHTS
ncbi:MAG: tautomerase family protein [Candidatus Bipolaricaulis sp.]|nr:tautomerase family protein [Candidatus Bipolaricaulis sp.]